MKFQLTAQQKTLEKGLEILLNAKGHQLAGDGICILPEPHTEKLSPSPGTVPPL